MASPDSPAPVGGESIQSPRPKGLLIPTLLMLSGAVLLALPGWLEALAMASGQGGWGDVLGAYQLTKSPPPILGFDQVLLGCLVTYSLAALAVAYLLFVRSGRRDVVTVRSVCLLLVLLAFVCPPALSTDVITYAAKGDLVVTHGVNPYIMTIAETVPQWQSHPLLSLDPWANLPDVYGFLWTWVMIGMRVVSNGGVMASLVLYKFLGVLGYFASLWAMWKLTAGQPDRMRMTAVAIFGFHPTLIWETVAMGHNESLMIPLWLGALLAVKRGRPFIGGLLFGFAAGVKWVPLFTLPLITLLLWESLAGQNRSKRFMAVGQFFVATLFALVVPALKFDPHLRATWVGIGSQSYLMGGGSVTFLVAALMDVLRGSGAKGLDQSIALSMMSTMKWVALGLIVGVTLGHIRMRKWAQPWTSHMVICMALCLLATAFLHPWYSLWALPFAVLARYESPRLSRVVIGFSLVMPLTLCVRIFTPGLGTVSFFLMSAVWILGTLAALLWGAKVWPDFSQPDSAQ